MTNIANNNTIIYMKGFARVDLKCSHRLKKKSNYVM